jgi:hypothetical protein
VSYGNTVHYLLTELMVVILGHIEKFCHHSFADLVNSAAAAFSISVKQSINLFLSH